MCDECGCGDVGQPHTHDHDHPDTHAHGHSQGHSHDHAHGHDHSPDETLVLSVREKVLARNEELAARNRAWLAERGVVFRETEE